MGFLLDALEELFADFSDSMVVVGAVGVGGLEESELWFVLLSFDEYLLEVQAVEGDVFSSLFEHFLMKGGLLLMSGGGMISPII